MSYELKHFLIRLSILIVLSPLFGFFLLRYADHFEKVWKTGNRRKKWMLMSGLFFLLACIGGWLL